MFIALLGRQPHIGMAELERSFEKVHWFSDQSALVTSSTFDITSLGGTVKAGRVVAQLSGDWRKATTQLVKAYEKAWSGHDGKITLGISAYGFPSIGPRDVQKTGLILKNKLKEHGVSLRLVPNSEAALNTATSHHNKLGLSGNKVELLIMRNRSGGIIIAESTGSQNITALARRDQERPKRDAFVGMLPPKLAQIMINLATPAARSEHSVILDPFCGTGVLLQEALLLGYNAYGTDLSDKMIEYSKINLDWIKTISHADKAYTVHQGDAMTTIWQQPITTVAGEAYLGQPFSAPPSPSKLAEVRRNCDHIIGSFFKNISAQLAPGTPLCIAVPAWRANDGSFTHLSIINKLEQFGFTPIQFKNVRTTDLLYYREDQIVARELLVLVKE